MVKPVTLPCGHSGCLQCFKTLLMYHESNGRTTAPCPECRISEFGKDSLNVSVALNSLTGGLDVRCTNNNCAWKGKFEDAKAHDETCPHRRVNCTNNGCPVAMERGQKDIHLAICQKQAVPCPECRRSVARDELSTHAKFRCIYARSTCPLGCGLNLQWYVFNVAPLIQAGHVTFSSVARVRSSPITLPLFCIFGSKFLCAVTTFLRSRVLHRKSTK